MTTQTVSSDTDIQSCRQLLLFILTQSDLILCQHPAYHIALLRDRNVLAICKDQPEFTKWLQRLKTLLQSELRTTDLDDTINLTSTAADSNSITLGWWAASLYLEETLRACPNPIVSDFGTWLSILSKLFDSSRMVAIQTFTSICIAVADTGSGRIDTIMQHISPLISKLISSGIPSDPATAIATLDLITRLSSALQKSLRQHSSRMLAYALSFADHAHDGLRRAAISAAAAVAASCTSPINIFDYISGLDRLLDRYLLSSLSNNAPITDDDLPFTSQLPTGSFPVANALRRWEFVCALSRAILDDDAASVSVPIENVLQTFARVLHCTVPVQLLGSITSHPISCLNLFSVLPALQSEVLTTLSSLCLRLGRRLLPCSAMIADLISALPLNRTVITIPATIQAIGAAIMEPVVIPAVIGACNAIRQAAVVPVAGTVVDTAIKRGKRRTAAAPESEPSAPISSLVSGPYLWLISCALQHVGDRFQPDVLQSIRSVLDAALRSPCCIHDRGLIYRCYRDLVSARYRMTPDLALLRQAGRVFASGQFGRHADICRQGLVLVQHLATPALPVALHQRVMHESIVSIEAECSDRTETEPCTVQDDRPRFHANPDSAIVTSTIPLCEADLIDKDIVERADISSPEPDPAIISNSMNDGGDEPLPTPTRSSPLPMIDHEHEPVAVKNCSSPRISHDGDQRVGGVKRKGPEPIVRSADSDAALLIDIGPDEADDQAPLWCF